MLVENTYSRIDARARIAPQSRHGKNGGRQVPWDDTQGADRGDTGAPQPPQAIEQEMALIGAILVNNRVYGQVAARLDATHFGHPALARIFDAAAQMIDGGGTANPATLSHFFARDPDLTEVGGAAFIARLAASVVSIANAPHYAEQIVDTWRRRRIIEAAWQAAWDAAQPTIGRDAISIARDLEDGLAQLAESGQVAQSRVTIRDAMAQAAHATEAAHRAGSAGGLSTGIRAIDDAIGGLFPGHLIVIAGRPGMGKSALAQTIASNVARRAEPVAFFSLEMAAADIGQRELAALTGIPADQQMTGKVDPDGIMRLGETVAALDNFPLHIFDRGGVGLGEVSRQCRALHRRAPLKLVVIDHLQLMRQAGKQEARRLELGAITGGLKSLAKELGLPIILLSQLSRAVEGRDDRRPALSDLRETGDIEQDADVVAFCFREEYYLERATPMRRDGETNEKFTQREADHWAKLIGARGKAQIILAKVRHSKTAVIHLGFDGPRMRFYDLRGGDPADNWHEADH